MLAHRERLVWMNGSAGIQVNTRQHKEIIVIYDLRSIMNLPFIIKTTPASPGFKGLWTGSASTGSRSRSFRLNTNPIYSILWACSAFVTSEVGRASARILDRLPRIRDPYRLMQKDHKPSRLIGNAWCVSRRCASSGRAHWRYGPTTGGPGMSKLRRAWDFVVTCLRVHHVYELLRDYFDGL